MIPIDQLYKKVAALSSGVKQEFRDLGIVIPRRGANGSILLGDYTVIKNPDGSYAVLDSKDAVVFGEINLSHSAILIANDIALGKAPESQLVENDKTYGYNTFEEDHYKKLIANLSKKKEWDRVETLTLKQMQARNKAKVAKAAVLESFEKLRRLR